MAEQRTRRARLTGWGRTAPSAADLVDVDADTVASTLKAEVTAARGALVRGLGRSYGDAAQNGGGLVLRLSGLAADAVIDEARHEVTVGGGVSIDELLRVVVPRGFFVPVTAGTRFVTIGGAIASDIHGKNHHGEGSFGNHVREMTLLLADGSTTVVSPTARPELFWATIGGMGLTGIVLEATIHVWPVETSRCIVDTQQAKNLDDILSLMEEGDHRYRYAVAWIDLMAKGRHLGRSILSRGDHARLDQLPERDRPSALDYHAGVIASVPPIVPMSAMNRATIKVFNELWFRKSPKHRDGELQTIPQYFHPLDMVGAWNRMYGPHGFVQYQILVPFGEEHALRQVIERLAGSGAASFVTVLKRFGAANQAPLSFPAPGWTLTLDIPAGTHGLSAMLHELDHVVLDAGGRHYMAKDSHTTPDAIRRGYPRLAEWQAVRNSVDPDGVWQSDLGRRLGLLG
ncbi:MAG: putative decaprenylphosphoryl-beta-D-ribose oxidase [Ilumatobacteraceae bacterium]|nr:putative decaprenylphosphoryl-beta-D-ribose oxidase [Ilumatobacteraceae bacterium]